MLEEHEPNTGKAAGARWKREHHGRMKGPRREERRKEGNEGESVRHMSRVQTYAQE